MSALDGTVSNMETTTPATMTGYLYCATCHKTRLHLINGDAEVCYFCGARR